jgi:Fibronectin type III domain
MNRQKPVLSSSDIIIRRNAQTIYANKLIREQGFINGRNKNLYSHLTNKDHSNYITTVIGGLLINYDISNQDRLILIANAGPIELPGAPTNVTGVAGNAQVTVSWFASSFIQFPVTSYVVTSSPGGFTATTTLTSVIVTGLTNEIGYTFTVVAINDIGQSPASVASAPFTPLAPVTVPGPPTDVTGVVAGSGTVTVSWGAPTSTGGTSITGYTVTVYPLPATGPQGYASLDFTYTFTNLTNGTPYTFTVIATNTQGNSAPSSSSAVTPIALFAPTVSSTSFVQNTSNNPNTVVFTGYITNNGGATITAMGVVYANSTPPTLANSVKIYTPTLQSGSFTIGPTFFASHNTYACTYATNSVGTTYSSVLNLDISICLAKGTLITLLNGLKKTIENILYTDILMVWDFDNGLFSEAQPLWIKKAETTTQYNLLKFSDGSTLKTINQHRIFNKEKGMFTYPMTGDTPLGTTTFNVDGNEVTLTSKEVVVEEVEYYNIITSRHMNLFANSILTSCRYNNIYPIAVMKFIKEERAIVPRSVYASIPDIYYDGLRLSEQVISVEDTINYVNNMESLKV